MSNTGPEPKNPQTTESPKEKSGRDDSWRWALLVALLVVFLMLVGLLWREADNATEVTWQRLVFLLAGVEAALFTAIGWAYGREAGRVVAVQAEKTAAKAENDSDQAKKESKDAAVVAGRLDTKLQSVRAVAASGHAEAGAKTSDLQGASAGTNSVSGLAALVVSIIDS
jgi:hypothetical protein